LKESRVFKWKHVFISIAFEYDKKREEIRSGAICNTAFVSFFRIAKIIHDVFID